MRHKTEKAYPFFKRQACHFLLECIENSRNYLLHFIIRYKITSKKPITQTFYSIFTSPILKELPLAIGLLQFRESLLFSTSPHTHHLSWLYPGYTHDVPTTFLRRSYDVPTTFLRRSYDVPTTFLRRSYDVPTTFLRRSYDVRTISGEIVRYKSSAITKTIMNYEL